MKIAGKKIGLSTQIFAAMLLGAVLGIVIGEPMTKVGFIGTIWLNCIKMIVVPMVLVTIVTGVVSQKDMKTLGKNQLPHYGVLCYHHTGCLRHRHPGYIHCKAGHHS